MSLSPRPERFTSSSWSARIDGVQTRDGFRVMEVEVNEPGLFFTHAPHAALRLADALLRAL